MAATPDGLDKDALVAGAYDTRMFRLTPRMKFMLAGGRTMRVREDTEKMIVLPNGHKVRVHQSSGGHATHIEENDRLHAVARPDTLRLKLTRQ
jgi:hypothetical protein